MHLPMETVRLLTIFANESPITLVKGFNTTHLQRQL